jgi:rhamnosyltransferase
LNQLIDFADSDGYEWLLTLDQDSICSPNMIEEYCSVPSDGKTAILCPHIVHEGRITVDEYKRLELPAVKKLEKCYECITSGCLMNISIAKSVGKFNAAFFIDNVDHDYNYRALDAGYSIFQVNAAYLLHELGETVRTPVLVLLYRLTKKKRFLNLSIVFVHSATRWYYIIRNTVYMRKKYTNTDILGEYFQTKRLILRIMKVTFLYPISCSRISYWRSIWKGFRDWNIDTYTTRKAVKSNAEKTTDL